MRVIYALGRPGQLEFGMTESQGAVPPGATIFAVCTVERLTENQDEYLFNTMTDEEYYELRAMVREAVRLEALRPPSRKPLRLALKRFFRWLTGAARTTGATAPQGRTSTRVGHGCDARSQSAG